MTNGFEDYLKSLIGKEIDLTIVHHVEGRRLTSTGILKEVTDDFIKLKTEWKDHWWSRTRKGVYVCNRNATSLLSIYVNDTE